MKNMHVKKTFFLEVIMFPTLEKYHGTSSRHTCPACNSRNCFVRYVAENGEYVSFDVGRCNRESKCGYHYKPKQYYADNPQTNRKDFKKGKKRSNSNYVFAQKQPYANLRKVSQPDYIAPEHLAPTIGHYDQNSFVQFLLNLFPDCSDEIQAVLKMYFVGTYKDGLTVFWQIGGRGKIRTGKIMRYDTQTGKRQIVRTWIENGETRELKIDWMHKKIKKDFNLKQIFFGEHLSTKYPDKPIAVVESEKTAIIAGLCLPQFVWLGSNSKTWLKAERLKRFGTRRIILYPDADGFDLWQKVAAEARIKNLNVVVSDLIEKHATDQEKADGFDLADYLINQQAEINELNEITDSYNAKLEMVLNDDK